MINDLSMLLFVFNVVRSLVEGRARAGDNPWGAGTLEWSTQLAAARLQLRRVAGRRRRASRSGRRGRAKSTHVSGLSAEMREGLVTTVLDALPDMRYAYPAPAIWPFVAALAVGILAGLVDLLGARLRCGD